MIVIIFWPNPLTGENTLVYMREYLAGLCWPYLLAGESNVVY